MTEQLHRELRIADEFIYGLSEIRSASLRERIRNLIRSIEQFPEMGSPDVRHSLVEQYGNGLRKVSVSTFVIIYRVTDETIEVLALVAGPTIA